MRKILFITLILLTAIIANAQQTVGSYQNSYFNKEYKIEASQKNDKITDLYIGVEAKSSRQAYISISGKDILQFKTALEEVRDKYLQWVKVAKENNVTDMSKPFGINFPSATIAWYGTKWWFSFSNKVNMLFVILSNGKMVASWAPKVTSSSNKYIDETIYFVFQDAQDFNNLISQLDPDAILAKLLNAKSNEDLFQ